MAARTTAATLILVIATLVTILSMLSGGTSQTTSSGCGSVIRSLSPCTDFVTGRSPKPTDTCCNKFGIALHNNLTCICQALGDTDTNKRYGINITIAVTLPDQCHENGPPSLYGYCTIPFTNSIAGYSANQLP